MPTIFWDADSRILPTCKVFWHITIICTWKSSAVLLKKWLLQLTLLRSRSWPTAIGAKNTKIQWKHLIGIVFPEVASLTYWQLSPFHLLLLNLVQYLDWHRWWGEAGSIYGQKKVSATAFRHRLTLSIMRSSTLSKSYDIFNCKIHTLSTNLSPKANQQHN